MSDHGSSAISHEDESPGAKLRAVEDLKKLSPEERIKRLKELEEERKKEIEAAESLIKETAREIAEEKKQIPIPEARATDLATLNTAEEKQIVSTHHFLTTETAVGTAPQPQQQQKKSLEEVAAEEAPAAQQQGQQLASPQMQRFQKPDYALGTGKQHSAFTEYLSKSQQTVTAAGLNTDGSPIEEKITDFYKEKSVTGAEAGDPQQKYFGTHQQVTGGYEMRKREEEGRKEHSDFYKRKAGPA